MLEPSDLLDRTYYHNTITAWLTAAAIIVGGWLLLVTVRGLLIRRLERFALRTKSVLDDVFLGGLRRTNPAFLLVLAVAVAAHVALELPPNATRGVEILARIAFLLQGASWGTGAISLWLERMTLRRGAEDKAGLTTLNVLGILLRLVLWTLLFLLALAAFGIDITALITGLGIAGVAVALAVQNVLGDLFASVSIALDKPFVIGDAIAVDNFNGTVEDIGLKTTRLRALSGETLVFSNADLLKSRIRNYRGQTSRRIQFVLNVAPDTAPDRLERVPAIVAELLTAEPNVRFERSHVSALGDAAFAVESVYHVTTGDYGVYMDVQQRLYLALLRRLAAEGIALARPVPPVVIENPSVERRAPTHPESAKRQAPSANPP